MATTRTTKLKKAHKTSTGGRRSSKTVVNRKSEVVPDGIGVVQEQPTSFDSGFLLTKIGIGKSRREYLTNQTVFSQGDPADAVFYIVSGKVKLNVVSKRGKEAVIAILPEDHFFGEGCLAGQPVRMATASALQRSTIVRVDKHVMLGLLRREAGFAQQFLTHLLSRNIRMEADLVDHLFNSSEKRLARLLLLMANFGQESKPVPVIAKMSQETLAEMIGTTRSRVSFFLNRFRELGFIDYNGGAGMQVHSSLISVVLHD
ncbi:MAG TPA: Crp/Fnr family transcriptional regulator [Terracidiphilus sp.]|nr:Crp/Fnr family transcriptional regulator [Terracidiphilus sp.]